MKLIITLILLTLVPISVTFAESRGGTVAQAAPEYIVRDLVEKFDDGYRAHIYLRWLQKDFEIQPRAVRLAANTPIVRVRLKVTLPYQSLFLSIPNSNGRDLDWWAKLEGQTATSEMLNEVRADIRRAYRDRTKESVDSDFTMRQLENYRFQFQIESVTLDPTSRTLARSRSFARKLIESGRLKPANETYQGLHGDFIDEPLISGAFHFDQLVPKAKGTTRDLTVNQMWTDRRGNYVAVLSSADGVTAAHYTNRHPFYFGSFEKPDMYQFYTRSEHTVFSKCQYTALKLEIFASTESNPGRTIAVQLLPNGSLHIEAPDDSTCLSEATLQQRQMLTERLKSGEVLLHNMPETREVISIYKMENANVYIYIDALARLHFPESYQMFMGAPGKLAPIEVSQVHQIDAAAGGAIIYTAAGTLHATNNYGSLSRPYWEDASGKTYLRPVVIKPRSEIVPFLQRLGVDLNRLREKPYQSPCEYLLRKGPALRLVI